MSINFGWSYGRRGGSTSRTSVAVSYRGARRVRVTFDSWSETMVLKFWCWLKLAASCILAAAVVVSGFCRWCCGNTVFLQRTKISPEYTKLTLNRPWQAEQCDIPVSFNFSLTVWKLYNDVNIFCFNKAFTEFYVVGLENNDDKHGELIFTQAVRVAIFYSKPQRLDVYVNKSLVAPTNAIWNSDKTDFTLKEPTFKGKVFKTITRQCLWWMAVM